MLTNKFLTVGHMILMLKDILMWTLIGKYDLKNTVNIFYDIGIKSLPIILITSFATGMVLALQLGIVIQNWFGYPLFVGMTVSFAFAKELSPILVSIVMAGRVGAAITAEISSMKVTEQLDALLSLGAHPIQYLAVPRFLGCLFMVPILVLIGYTVSLLGGLLVSVVILDLPSTVYLSDALDTLYLSDIMHGLIKACFFAMIIAWVSIFRGFTCKQGAEGVGKATTNAVVTSIILILISDYFLTSILVALGIGNGR
ncbi:MAG: ABC transporter permease [bacterium]|nr:ABC transporter permease [bacterium]